MKNIVLTAIAVALTGVVTPSVADDNQYGNDRRQQIRDYFRCAFTPAAHFPGTIVEAALATPELEQLANAVVAAGLVDALNSEGPFTVYAPINSAFENIPAGVLNGIISETDADGNLVEINQSNLVSCQPVRTTNGIVFLIDSVLLPQF